MEQEEISKLLQQELPGLTGFSETNIKNMRIFYEAWSPYLNRQMPSADLYAADYECFLSVGFSSHREIIRKTTTLKERLFYIRRCAKEFWDVFSRTIVNNVFKQRALQSFKDEYMLDFINIEDPELVDERVIEQQMTAEVTNKSIVVAIKTPIPAPSIFLPLLSSTGQNVIADKGMRFECETPGVEFESILTAPGYDRSEPAQVKSIIRRLWKNPISKDLLIA